jgi:hypothetical protein
VGESLQQAWRLRDGVEGACKSNVPTHLVRRLRPGHYTDWDTRLLALRDVLTLAHIPKPSASLKMADVCQTPVSVIEYYYVLLLWLYYSVLC